MSDLEARQRAIQEQAYHEAAELEAKRLELKKTRRAGQGEFLGDVVGAVGASLGSGLGRLLVMGSQVFIMATIGLWFAYMLWSAT